MPRIQSIRRFGKYTPENSKWEEEFRRWNERSLRSWRCYDQAIHPSLLSQWEWHKAKSRWCFGDAMWLFHISRLACGVLWSIEGNLEVADAQGNILHRVRESPNDEENEFLDFGYWTWNEGRLRYLSQLPEGQHATGKALSDFPSHNPNQLQRGTWADQKLHLDWRLDSLFGQVSCFATGITWLVCRTTEHTDC